MHKRLYTAEILLACAARSVLVLVVLGIDLILLNVAQYARRVKYQADLQRATPRLRLLRCCSNEYTNARTHLNELQACWGTSRPERRRSYELCYYSTKTLYCTSTSISFAASTRETRRLCDFFVLLWCHERTMKATRYHTSRGFREDNEQRDTTLLAMPKHTGADVHVDLPHA